jgi:hypothetical protein
MVEPFPYVCECWRPTERASWGTANRAEGDAEAGMPGLIDLRPAASEGARDYAAIQWRERERRLYVWIELRVN